MGAADSTNWRASARSNSLPSVTTTTTTTSSFSLRSYASDPSFSSITSSNTSTNPWVRRGSGTPDSGYESKTRSRPASLSQLSLSRCDCHEYAETYQAYKEHERVVRRWLCDQSGRQTEDSDLDNIDIGSLIRMAERAKVGAPYSVASNLRKAIDGRKAVIGRWHWVHADHTCSACGRVWRQVDESHNHHIRELERMLVILGLAQAPVSTKVDPMSLRSWR